MISAWFLLSLLAALVYGFVRLNAKAKALEAEKAAAEAAWLDLAGLIAPRIQTRYDAPLSAEEATQMQRLVGFGAVMDALNRRTSWRRNTKVEVTA